MSINAHRLKANDYIYHNDTVFLVSEVHQCRVGNGSSVKVKLVNPLSHHKTSMEFAHNHCVRTLEPVHTRYTVQYMTDIGEGLEVALVNRDTYEPRNFTVVDDSLITYLHEHYNESGVIDHGADILDCVLTSMLVNPIHRVDRIVQLEFMSKLDGFVFTHLHDKHYGKHHSHSHSHSHAQA